MARVRARVRVGARADVVVKEWPLGCLTCRTRKLRHTHINIYRISTRATNGLKLPCRATQSLTLE